MQACIRQALKARFGQSSALRFQGWEQLRTSGARHKEGSELEILEVLCLACPSSIVIIFLWLVFQLLRYKEDMWNHLFSFNQTSNRLIFVPCLFHFGPSRWCPIEKGAFWSSWAPSDSENSPVHWSPSVLLMRPVPGRLGFATSSSECSYENMLRRRTIE